MKKRKRENKKGAEIYIDMIAATFGKNFMLNSFIRKRSVSLFCINEEVRQAFSDDKPVVALESAIITHGMKFPHNYNTAREVENIVRQQNAVPATIAVIRGQIKVGLSRGELEELSGTRGNCVKVSKRDFPYVIGQKLSGGTTVSGTITIARKVGIPIFVTGGVGGVHRGSERTMDVSADLTDLGKTSIAVISSGVKSILDIAKTLEYLETQGVAVATFGPSSDFPAFYCRTSGHKVPYNLRSYKDAAEFVRSAANLNSGSGVLIAVPVPEEHSLDEKVMENAIERGLREVKEKNLRGKDVTPFLLNRLSEITGGKSLRTNIALMRNNALVGAKIAAELGKLGEHEGKRSERVKNYESFGEIRGSSDNKSESFSKNDIFDVVVVGGTNLDFVVNIKGDNFKGIMKYRQTDRVAMVQQFKEVKDNPQPKAVFFTCIDSRMIPTRFTETCVGDMFVVRNAGNIIPHSMCYPDEITTNEPAALELGCVLNDVRHVIVCGHSDCKAMNLLYSLRSEEFSSQTNRRMSPLRAWMCAHASSSLERFLKMQREGMERPLVFHAETPLRKFVAYIDPENKFRTEDKLSQTDGRTIGGKINRGGGGVARNVADALGKLQVNPFLISVVGDEPFGNFVLEETIPHLDASGITMLKGERTGTCMVLCDRAGECLVVVGDMAIHEKMAREHVSVHEEVIAASSLVVLDGNLSRKTSEFVLRLCRENSVPVWFEPTDVFSASKPFLSEDVPMPAFISPNVMEFRKIFEAVHPKCNIDENTDEVEECLKKGYMLAELIHNVIITLGRGGVIVIRRGGASDPFFNTGEKGKKKLLEMRGPISHRIYNAHKIGSDEIVNESGAGDCFASGFIAAMLKGESEKRCVESGLKCAAASLKCSDAVPKRF